MNRPSFDRATDPRTDPANRLSNDRRQRGSEGATTILKLVEPPPPNDPSSLLVAHWANPLIAKLNSYVALADEDIGAIEQLCRHRRSMASGATLVHEGVRLCSMFVILTGVAYRYRFLADGRRQIFGYLLPGDVCDSDFLIADRCDHTICLLTDAEVAVIPITELETAIRRFPRIGHALMHIGQGDGALLRGWLLNVGQRHALQRIANFLCEMSAQLYSGTLGPGSSLPMPLTQHELADTMGLTVVHVNRCLQRLRDDGLIAWHRKRVTIIDRDRLLHVAGSEEPLLTVEQVAPPQPWAFARGIGR